MSFPVMDTGTTRTVFCLSPSPPYIHELQSDSSAGTPTLQQHWTGFSGQSREWTAKSTEVWVPWLPTGLLGCSMHLTLHVNTSLRLRVFRGEHTSHGPHGPDSADYECLRRRWFFSTLQSCLFK